MCNRNSFELQYGGNYNLMTKKKLAIGKNQYMPAIAVSFIFLLLVGFVAYNKQLNTKKEVSEIDQTVSVTDAGEWPTYPETQDWDVYENKEFGYKIKYPPNSIFLYNELENTTVFTTQHWKGAIVIPPIGLQITSYKDIHSTTKAIWDNTLVPDGVNKPTVNAFYYDLGTNKALVNKIKEYGSGKTVFIESPDGRVVKVYTYDDVRLSPEEQASNLRELNMMISTFEYLD